ncbi:hypothetical protein FRC16_001271, partial [Serendipita sp. 398]
MSSVTISLPQDYGLVAAAAISTGFLTVWQGTVVHKWRSAANIKYPQTFAEVSEMKADKNAHVFNCAQRAHFNMLEHLPPVLVSLLWCGLQYPRTAAGLGFLWVFSRVLYTRGYITGEPKRRYDGATHHVAEYGLYLLGLWSSWELFNGK